MAKIYTKTVHVDETIVGDETYEIRDDEGNVLYNNAKISLASSIAVAGTTENAAVMNNIEDGIDGLDDKVVALEGLTNGNSTPVKNSGAEIITGTDDAKFSTAKALRDAGVLPYEVIGGVVYHKLYIGAKGWAPTLTNGCAPVAQIEMGTNKNVYDYLAFDKDAIEYAYINFEWPYEYAGSTLLAKFNWLHPATTTNFKVAWGLQGVCFADGDSLDAAQGTAQYANDTGGTENHLYQSPVTSAITLAGTPTAGKLCQLRAQRYATSGTYDTLAVDAYLLGVLIYYPVV